MNVAPAQVVGETALLAGVPPYLRQFVWLAGKRAHIGAADVLVLPGGPPHAPHQQPVGGGGVDVAAGAGDAGASRDDDCGAGARVWLLRRRGTRAVVWRAGGGTAAATAATAASLWRRW